MVETSEWDFEWPLLLGSKLLILVPAYQEIQTYHLVNVETQLLNASFHETLI